MKDKKTLREIIIEARANGADSFNIMNDVDVLEDLKRVVERRGDKRCVEEIQNQINSLKGHSKEEILEILETNHEYHGANRLSITALYDHEDVFDRLESGNKKRPIPCAWSVCRDSDPIDGDDIDECYKPLILQLPMDRFRTPEEAVDEFFRLYPMEENGINTYNRCGRCKYFSNGCNHPNTYNGHLLHQNEIVCKNYEYNDLEE